MGFSVLDWVVIASCAGLTGFSETGIPGTGILAVPLIALVMPARQSTGFLLPMLILAMRFDKKQFIGTQAWFFWIVNLSKLPLSGRLGLVTAQTLQANLLVLPAILAGGLLGILLVHRISRRTI